MRQALHIFRKDIRHLWPEISNTLTLAAAFAFAVARQAQSLNDFELGQGVSASLLTSLLPLSWAVLIARLIYDEPLPGDRQFWLTRPYSRASLLAAKALSIAVFVNIPKLLGDVVILRAYGFPLRPELAGLLWTQVLLTALFVLPIVALCAVTTGFVQLIIVVVLVGVAVAGSEMLLRVFGPGTPWLGLEWTRLYGAGLVIAAAALAIVVWQYARRDTARARFLGGAAVVAAFLVVLFFPWRTAFAIQARLSTQPTDASRVHVGYDPQMKSDVRAFVDRDQTVEIQVPLRITGVPSPLAFMVERIVATIEGPGGEVWRTRGDPGYVQSTAEATTFRAVMGASVYRRIKNDPIRIRGTMYLTLYGNPRRMVLPVRDRAVFLRIPGVGLCAAVRTAEVTVLNCRAAFRARPDLVRFDYIASLSPEMELGGTLSVLRRISYSPFPADADLIPVTQSMQTVITIRPVSGFSALALEPVAYIQRDFEVTGLRLAESEVVR